MERDRRNGTVSLLEAPDAAEPQTAAEARARYLRHLLPLVVVAIVGWAAFLLFFQHFFPNDYDPAQSRTVLWAWLAGGTLAFVALMFTVFWLFRTPPDWRAGAAIAMLAPALCLDAFATTFYLDWFPDSAPAEPTAYAAVLLGGVGVLLLVAVVHHRPRPAVAASDEGGAG